MLSESVFEASQEDLRGALDSAASSHTIKEDCLPKGTKIDQSRATVINTARKGHSLSSLGRADAGILKNSLITESGDLNKNLISVPAFDRAGYTTVFKNGKGKVYDQDDKIIAEASLSDHTNLYELDIGTLTKT